MQALVEYMVQPLVQHAEYVRVNVVEGSASVLYELRVHPEDLHRVRGTDGQLVRAMQQILSVAGGARKPVLDLLDTHAPQAEE